MVPYHNSRRLLQRMCKTRTLLGVDLRPCHNIRGSQNCPQIMLVLLDEYRGFQWHPLDGRPEKSIGPTTLPSIITSRMITMRVLWMTVRCIFDREPQ